jgi:hypothetical protein
VSAPVRLAAFGAFLAVIFGGAALAGAAVDPRADTESGSHGEGEQKDHAMTSTRQPPVRGLALAGDDLRLVVEDPDLRRGRDERLRFRVVDRDGATVRDFDVEHERRMHLILVRRDLTGFQHLHPEQDASGVWETTARLDHAGSYRLLADFARGGTSSTLGADLRVDGRADLRALPEPADVATTGGYEVRLAEAGGELRFAITRDGRPVQVEPYLGAGGHLVALRDGDLAFLHVHPTAARAGSIGFETEFPSAGRYRLFLQFKHEGRVQTVAFTRAVA